MATPTPTIKGSNGTGAGRVRPTVSQVKGLEAQIAAMSALLDRASLAARAGLSFEGERDLYKVFGYKRVLTFDDYLQKYTRQDLAARVIDAPAAGTWKNPPTIEASEEFLNAWNPLAKQHKIWTVFERADKLAGLGRFSVILLGFSDATNFEEPVRTGGNRQNQLLYMQPIAECGITIKEFEDDPTDSRFNQPRLYELELTEPSLRIFGSSTRPTAGDATSKITAHHSRVLHIVENPLEDMLVGIPRLARVFNVLDDILKVVGGSAETFWLTGNRGLQADIDKEMEIDPADAAVLADALDEYQHQLRRVLRTRGVKIQELGSHTIDPRGAFEVLLSVLAGATGIPQRILLGSEAGQLSSEQDRSNWADRLAERQVSFGETIILDPLVKKLIVARILPDDPDIEYIWPDAFNLSPLEKAQTMAQSARAVVNLSRQSKDGTPVTTQEEAREILGLEGPGPDPTPTPAPALAPQDVTEDEDN